MKDLAFNVGNEYLSQELELLSLLNENRGNKY